MFLIITSPLLLYDDEDDEYDEYDEYDDYDNALHHLFVPMFQIHPLLLCNGDL